MAEDMNERVARVHRLFMRKLAAEDPMHPWVLKAQNMKWHTPRPVDRWFWMDIEVWENGEIQRVGRVCWPKEGGLYDVSITYESEHGLGLYCWPAFRVLSDAQDFVERLMNMASAEARTIHGTQWPHVVL